MKTVRTFGTIGALALLVLHGHPAKADPVATGTVAQLVQGTSQSGTFTFDDAPFTVFGTPVNFGGGSPSGSFVGSMTYAGQIVFVSNPPYAASGTTTSHADASVPGRLSFDVSTEFLCTFSGLFHCSIVGSLTSITGSVATTLPTGLVYVADSTDSGDGTNFSGVFVINAFQPVGTPTGANVTVPTHTSFLNSATQSTVALDVTVTFPQVTSAGTTTVTAMSNVAGQVPANLSFAAGATFVDVSTTATADTSGGPITICVSYGIAGPVSDPNQLRLVHDVGGTWVDVTSSIDTGTGIICGAVSSLSPFGVAVAGASTTTSTSTTTSSTSSTLPVVGCPSSPTSDCHGALPGKASLVLGNGKLTWKWRSLGTVATSDFGTPLATTDYRLCVYGGSGLGLDAKAPGGATCGTKPCWKALGTSGFKYARKDGAPEGLTAIQLKAGLAGKAKIGVKGKGSDLALPPLPVTAPVTVQIRRTDGGACWAAVYSTPMQNNGTAFKAKSDTCDVGTCNGCPGCANATGRFVDNGDGTVSDCVGRLQWERKTGSYTGAEMDCLDPACVHDVNVFFAGNDQCGGAGFYTYSLSGALNVLNDCSTGGFAGHCDWRVPTLDELLTICGSATSQLGPYNPADWYWGSAEMHATMACQTTSFDYCGDEPARFVRSCSP